MATILNNFATLVYNSGEDTEAATSNVVSTNLLESAGISVEKYTANSSWRPAENIVYFVTVTNTGTEALENVTVTDDLGGETDPPMFYVQGSARIIVGAEVTEVTPTDTNPLVIPIADTLLPEESVVVLYVARVNATIDDDVNSITNTATAQGEGAGCGGEVSDESSVTLFREDFAQVNVLKAVDKSVISCGDTLTYTFSLENSGNIPATNVVITDTLPAGFVITSISSVTNGVTTVYDEGDYTVGADNTLILPTGEGVTITVPARTQEGNGLTTVIVTGVVTG